MAYLLWNLPCFGTSSTAPFEFFFSSFPPFPSFFIWFFLSFLLTSLSLLCQLLFLSLSSLPSSKPREEGRSKKEMCPLRLILIFLSATLAGFFVLKKLNNSYDDPLADPLTDDADPADSDSRFSKVSSFFLLSSFSLFRTLIFFLGSQVGMAMKTGFWTCVDMASGRYLWNHLCSNSDSSS